MRLSEAKTIEFKNIKEALRIHPRLFEKKTFIDSADFLEKYGIFFEKKKKFPLGYLKLWPQDFIVEEMSPNRELQTVFPDKFLHTKREFLPEEKIIYATLVKCKLSTIEAAEELAQDLRIEQKNIKFAGIKDKQAITSQLISIKGTDIEKLYQVSVPNFFLKNIFSQKKELYLGALEGNQFTILIRTGPDFKKEDFLKRLKETEKNGFFNFFYLQRFGVPRLTNPYCGLCLLKGEYEKAIFTAICQSGERELPYFRNMRKEIEKLWGKWEEILDILEFFPLTFRDERQLIGHLAQYPNDFLGALNQIPRVVQLWLTSFSALFFNKLLSFYIQQRKTPPETLPLVLSQDREDWSLYKNLLNQVGIFSFTFALKNLKPFLFISLRKKRQKTTEKVQILNQKVISEGVILNFILPKGCYATTFLSHFFNLISGAFSSKFSNLPIDTKANLNQPSLEEILNKFSEVISSPSWDLFWGIS